MPVTSGNTGRFLFQAYWMGGSSGSTDGGGYGDPYHSNPTVNCADRAVVRLRQIGAVILYRLERPGSDATRAHKHNGRLIPPDHRKCVKAACRPVQFASNKDACI